MSSTLNHPAKIIMLEQQMTVNVGICTNLLLVQSFGMPLRAIECVLVLVFLFDPILQHCWWCYQACFFWSIVKSLISVLAWCILYWCFLTLWLLPCSYSARKKISTSPESITGKVRHRFFTIYVWYYNVFELEWVCFCLHQHWWIQC